MKHAFAIALWLLLAGPIWALEAGEMFDDPAKEARAREIGRQLRCLVCQNQSIFDSNAALAKDLRVVVRERMELGENDGEILDYVAQRYGDYVLLNPRVRGATYALWIAPLVFVFLGAGTLMLYHRRRAGLQAPETLSEDERAEARRLLRQE